MTNEMKCQKKDESLVHIASQEVGGKQDVQNNVINVINYFKIF